MTISIPKGMVPIVSSYSNDGPGGVVRTDVAGGAPRYGLDWDRGTQQFRVTLILDALKYSAWSMFYHHIIKKGSLSFEMTLDSGMGCMPHLVNIVPGSYTATRTVGILTAVAFVVEAEATAYSYTGDDAQSLVDMYDQYTAGVFAFMDRLAKFANVDSVVLDFGL